MCSASRFLGSSIVCLAFLAGAAHAAALRVCADPNNLPFSNAKGEGFENAIARLVADELGRSVEYTWMPQRRGFIRNTLKAKRCDVVMGVPAHYDLVQATAPYYRSTYVFVTRKGLSITSLDDPRLRTLKIGFHVVGDDYASVPPAQALAARGIVQNVRGYSIYGDYSKPNPPRALIDAVARGDIDVALAWGPFAGYFAPLEPVALEIAPVAPRLAAPQLPMDFSIAMGVRHGDKQLESLLEGVLRRRGGDIRKLLAQYGVPLVEE